jgi:dTMP kinase
VPQEGLNAVVWITLEGINGVGKTYLAHAAAGTLGGSCRLVAELTDLDKGGLPGQVVTALAAGGGTFLRGGCPSAETLALLALKIHTYENARARWDAPGLVLEDRGVDTVALYQAAILTGAGATVTEALAVADRVYAMAGRWRPAPHRTVLLVDDVTSCLSRFERRIGESLSAEDRVLLTRVADLYLAQAAREPGRFIIIDRRGRDGRAVTAQLRRACLQAAKDLSCPA